MNSLHKGSLILLAGFLLLKFGGILFRIICISFLPVSAYGEVAVFLVLFNWFMLFATLNVTIGMAKFISQDRKRGRLYYVSGLAGSMGLSAVVCIFLLAFAPAIAASLNLPQSVIYWAVAAIPFATVYNIGIFYYRGLYRMGDSVATDFIMTAVRLAALLLLLMAGLYYAPFLAFLISFMAIDVYLVLRNRSREKLKSGEISSTFRKLLIYSLPIFVSEILRAFAMGLDRIMLSGFYSTAEAGFYDVAVSLCLAYMMIASSYSNALLPVASSGGAGKRRSELISALKASSALFVVYTAVLIVGGGPFVNLINPAYAGVLEFMMPLAAAYMLMGFLTILCFYANGTGRQMHAVYAGAVFAFLSLVLNLYLIPEMMYMGAIYSLIISSTASLAVMGALIWKR